MKSTPSIFFILGRERSGSTLLQRLLNAHPALHIPQESPFIRHLYNNYAYRKNWNSQTTARFIDDLFTEPYFNQWNLDRNQVQNKLSNLATPNFAHCCRAVIQCSTSKQAEWLGDKNPQYILFANQLIDAFPFAKFICIVRDYRAQVASMKKVSLETRSTAALAIRWNYLHRKLIAFSEQYPEQTLVMRYEDLVTSPESSLNSICRFLEIPYTDTMLSTSPEQLESNTFYHDLHHKSVKQPLTTHQLNEWKTTLTVQDVTVIEHLCAKTGTQLGYSPTIESTRNILNLNYWPALWYGLAYFPFLKILYSLPLNFRNFIFRKLIYPNFTFWKEMKSTHQPEGKR